MAKMSLFSLLIVFVLNVVMSDNIGVRKNIIHLSQTEKDGILNALYLMKQSPSKYNPNITSFDYFAYTHKLSTAVADSWGHCQWSFLPWHRAFLYLFEKELQYYSNNSEIMLPYWDLSNQLSTNIVLSDTTFLGGNGNETAQWILNQNNYSLNCDKFPMLDPSINSPQTEGFTCLSRDYGRNQTVTLPDIDIWDEILQNEDLEYDTYPYNSVYMNYSQYNTSFRAMVEGCDPRHPLADIIFPNGVCLSIHGQVHTYIGGQLSSGASPLDPLFFMLHNWIDLMWAKYQDKYGDDTFPMQFADISLFTLKNEHAPEIFNGEEWTSHDVLNHRESLFYLYDVQIAQEIGKQNSLDTWVYVVIVVATICILITGFIMINRFCCRKPKGAPYQNL